MADLENQYEGVGSPLVSNENYPTDDNSDRVPMFQNTGAKPQAAAPSGAAAGAPDWRSEMKTTNPNVAPTVDASKAPDWRTDMAKPEESTWSRMGNAIKKDWAASADALAAAMLQDESSDRSRYAMKRAQRTNEAAAKAEEGLSTMESIGTMAAGRMAPGLAVAAVPYVGPAAAATVFGAQGTADVLRAQAQDTGRYDLAKAAQAGVLMAGVDAATGGLAGTGERFATRVAQKAAQGAASGTGQQAIMNLASGRPWNENLGVAAAGGAVAGGTMHAGAEGIGKLARRMPTTLDSAGEAFQRNADTGAASRLQKAFEAERQARNVEGGEEIPTGQAAPGEAGATVEQPTMGAGRTEEQAGAIPTGEPEAAPQPGVVENENGLFVQGTDGQMYPATRTVGGKVVPQDPSAPFNYEVGDGSNAPAGMGFGPGARPKGETPMGGAKQEPLERVQGMADHLRESLKLARNPVGAARATESELAATKAGMNISPAMRNAQQEVEKSSAILQEHISKMDPDDPSLSHTIQAKVNLEANHGTPAALGRRDQLAAKVDFTPMTTWNDRTVTEGWGSGGEKYHLGEQFGSTRAEMEADKIHLRDAGENQVFRSKNPQMSDELITRASYLNDAHTKYNKGKVTFRNALNDNIEKVTILKNQLENNSASKATAIRLERNLKAYQERAMGINKNHLDVDDIKSLSHDIETDVAKLGLHSEMKNLVGQKGDFSPMLDMEGWDHFHKSMKAIDENIPTHSYKGDKKETAASQAAELATSGAITAINPVVGIGAFAAKKLGPEAVRATDRAGLRKSQVKGRVMAQELVPNENIRARAVAESTPDAVQAALKKGGFDEAAVHAQNDLEEMGINTGENPPEAPAAAPVEPAPSTPPSSGGAAVEAPIAVPEAANNVVPSVLHRQQLEAINHPRAYDDELSRGEAEAILAQHAANQRAAGMANRPTNEVPEAAPETTHPAVEDFWNQANELGRQRANERAAQEARTPTRRTQEEAQEAPVEEQPVQEPEATPVAEEAPVEAPIEPAAPKEPLPRKPKKKAKETTEETPVEETAPVQEEAPAPKEPLPRKPKAKEEPVVEEAPAEPTPKAEPEKLAAKPKAKEEPAKEEAAVEETNPAETKVPEEEVHEGEPAVETSLKEGETQQQRAERVSQLAKADAMKRANEVLKTPVRELEGKTTSERLKVRNRAEQVKAKMPKVSEIIKTYADKHQFNEGDLWESLMKRKGGIESVFDRGFGDDAIKGVIGDHITASRRESARIAAGQVDEAGNIIRRSLEDHAVPPNREEAHRTLRKELKEVGGLDDAQVEDAFKRARKSTPFFTPAQVRRHAATILKEEAAKALEKKGTLADTKVETVSTHDALHAYADKLDIKDADLKQEIHGIITKATNGGKDELGVAEQKALTKEIDKAIRDQAKMYRKAANETKNKKIKKTSNEKADAVEASLDRKGAADTELNKIHQKNESATKVAQENETRQKAENESKAKKLNEAAEKVEESGKKAEENVKKAAKEGREKLKERIKHMSGEELEMAGGIVGDRIPEVDSVNDPEFIQWKSMMEETISGLREKNRPRPAHVLSTVLELMELGMKRREELPDPKHKELIWSEKDYQKINQALGVDEEGDLDYEKAFHNYYGNLGKKLRANMLGSSKPSARTRYIHLSDRELKAARAAAKDIGEAGIDTAGVVEKTRRGALDTE